MNQNKTEEQAAERGAARAADAMKEKQRLKEAEGYFKCVLDEYSGNAYVADTESYELLYINRTSSETLQLPIDWEGRRCRLELSIDNFSSEYKLEKMDRERKAILRTIPGGFARVDAKDGKTITWYGGDFLHMIGYTKEQFEG